MRGFGAMLIRVFSCHIYFPSSLCSTAPVATLGVAHRHVLPNARLRRKKVLVSYGKRWACVHTSGTGDSLARNRSISRFAISLTRL